MLGAGNDVYIATGAFGTDATDVVDGGAGIDTYNASAASASVVINFDLVAVGAPAAAAFGDDVSGDAIGITRDFVFNFENFIGGSGGDLVFGSSVANRLEGRDGNDTINGRAGNDTILGGDGEDDLAGGEGNDWLEGGADNDVAYGLAGRDTLKGDGGDDQFLFFSKLDSGLTVKTRDAILDFEGSGVAGGDLIDLSTIDADEATGGDQAFAFTANNGLGAFQIGTAGQLRYQNTKAGTLVFGETNGDGKADFSILMKGQHSFSIVDGEDFIL